MTRLAPCSRCGQHIFVGSATCPHCGASFHASGSPLTLGTTALLLGLTLSATACPTAQSKYGDTWDSGEPCEQQLVYSDADGDGYGNPSAVESLCEIPSGYVTDNTDCDDADAAIHPGATETPGDGIDSNCDDADDT